MRLGNRRAIILGLALLGMIHATVRAGTTDEAAQMRSFLEREFQILRWLERNVERLDFARLRLIQTNVRVTLDALSEKGLAHARTSRALQQLIITFRFSSAFFTQIETDETRVRIKELLALNDDVVRKLGFDDTPFTQITANVFTQQHKLFLQLRDSATLSSELHKKVSDLVVPMGHLIALAKQGDRPKTFDAAIPLHRKIVVLYPEFNRISSTHAAFDVVIEIQGLNEFYGEFAQVGH